MGQCVLCSSATHDPFFEENGYLVVRCTGCRLLFSTTQPEESELAAMYDREQCLSAAGTVICDDRAYSTEASHRLDAEMKFSCLAPFVCAPGRLLDIGCGIGHLVEVAREVGFDAEGTELSRSRVEHARDRGLTVHHGDLIELSFPAEAWDVVTAVNLLSHLRDPIALIREMSRILRPGGTLFVVTGNKAELETYRDGTALTDYWGLPEHLFFFGEPQLRRALDEAGLGVLVVDRLAYLDGRFSPERLRWPGPYARLRTGLARLPAVHGFLKAALRRYWYRGRTEPCSLRIVARKRTAEVESPRRLNPAARWRPRPAAAE